MNAAHYKLGNLVAFVDFNGLESDGTIDAVTGLGNIAEKYRAFGWNVQECNGNSMAELKAQMDSLPSADSDQPTVLICHTVKGKGVSFMENQVKWHAGRITEEQYQQALTELTVAFSKRWGEC